MEALEVAEFTTKWKMYWFLPDEPKCLNDQTPAEVGFGLCVEPIYPTRCRSCAKKILDSISDPNKTTGLKALAELP